jgi:S-adenosylmethionine:tRNA ribosyltransferase-isomerase
MSLDRHDTVSADPREEAGDIPRACRLATYQYHLPPELIAQEPAPDRDGSRLLVIHRTSGETSDHTFRDLPSLLKPSDLLVFNETRVVPARLRGAKPTGGAVELLVLAPAFSGEPGASADRGAVRTCLVRSSKRLRTGATILIENAQELVVEEIPAPGRAVIRFPVPEHALLEFLNRYGEPPLPPYIRPVGRDMAGDRLRYQTVYAKAPGSVAAPTAGLHFTRELLGQLAAGGMDFARVVLHVGPGTFTPVRHEDIRGHAMETESYEIPETAAEKIANALAENRRVIAVGTTSVRALESAAGENGVPRPGRGRTALFITPGYRFRTVQGLITNFHLPGSTLLMMVAALGGTDVILMAYEKAVRDGFRFYSFGDACLLID